MKKMNVNIAGVDFKVPVTTASGTFASGREYSEFCDLSELGAITVKGISDKPWKGNPPPRIAEVYGGMLNSVGLQNSGIDEFIKNDLPILEKFGTKIIANIAGHTIEEYMNVIDKLSDTSVDMLELNISCPNIEDGGLSFGTDAKLAEKITRAAKDRARQPLIVKLSPNVTDITEIARAVESGGADAVSMINTLIGMRININTKKPILANKKGGLSGPAIKPIAIRMVYEVFNAVKLPIIGMGGIMNGDDAVEFMLAGASAVACGMASFNNPRAAAEIIGGIANYMDKFGISDVTELIGAANSK